MKITKKSIILAIAGALICSLTIFGQQRLVVVGGGTRPQAAMEKFVGWAGGAKARILVVTWATAEPEASFAAFKKDIDALHPALIEHAPDAPIDAAKRAVLVDELKSATAVFFTGGDQNRIMDVLADAELLRLFREKYAAGTVFGGTSAGAAVLSDPMMTGEADLKILDGTKVGLRTGIGSVPNVMFDQHFFIRQRLNRLFGFVMQNPAYLGVGIDESTAVLISDNRSLEVAGKTQVMVIDAKDHGGSMVVNVLKPGEWFDLQKRKRVGPLKEKK